MTHTLKTVLSGKTALAGAFFLFAAAPGAYAQVVDGVGANASADAAVAIGDGAS